jgi:acyl carrier protein
MELFNEVASIISQNLRQPNIRPQDHLHDDLHIGSFDTLMIGCDLEDYFHVTLEPEEIKNLNVVQDLVNILEQKVSALHPVSA